MKTISISDMTLALNSNQLSFKEKIEIARHLDNLCVDVIDMPIIKNATTDTLLIRTISAFCKNSAISVEGGLTEESIDLALNSIQNAKKSRLKITVPVSTVQMEYTCHKKPAKMLDLLDKILQKATYSAKDVELFTKDTTRLDKAFFKSLVQMAVKYGVKTITLSDDEGVMLPYEFASFINEIKTEVVELNSVKVAVMCKNTNGMAIANAMTAIKEGVDEVKTVVKSNEYTETALLCNVLTRSGSRLNAKVKIASHELNRIINQITWILSVAKGESVDKASAIAVQDNSETIFDNNDTFETVVKAVKTLGYDLSDEDNVKVYDEFIKLANRKTVGLKELDAIVAGVALQVPPTYILESYVINNGNLISSSAQIKLKRDDKYLLGMCVGDGPVDASFKALEQIIGTHYELEDFQIQSVTEGREAMGLALVKLRYNGKIYSGSGISTDIIGSSIRAYINAVNKIVYGEN